MNNYFWKREEGKCAGRNLSSDAGALLLRQPGHSMGLGRAAGACFHGRRNPGLIKHGVGRLLAQRIHALAPGCGDLNDHEHLRHATLFAPCAGEPGLKPGAPAPTPNRLERPAGHPKIMRLSDDGFPAPTGWRGRRCPGR
ncbi:MAG: transposase [Opitutaceae bacterium]|nr:transposase [Opitutaceae bacterium]